MSRKPITLALCILVLPMLLAACGGDTPTAEDLTDLIDEGQSALDEVVAEVEADGSAGEEGEGEELPPLAFTYTGETGPDGWAELPGNEDCAGTAQSPIDVTEVMTVDVTDLGVSYSPSTLRIENNGHTVKATYDDGSTLTVDDQTYALVQLHAHSPSEHTVDGQSFPMEIHLVHQVADGGPYAVLGLLVEEGADNPALAPFLDNIPTERAESPTTIDGVAIDAAALLPSPLDTYRYEGSFTTPPCTEGVSWNIAATPITASAEQVAAFTDVLSGNNRPVQPGNDRPVELDTASG